MDNNISILNIKEILESYCEIKFKNIRAFYDYLFNEFEDNMNFDDSDYSYLSNRDSQKRKLSNSKRNKVVEFLKEEQILKNLQNILEKITLEHSENVEKISADFF